MILFRADGNKIIGSGHIMRCLSLAAAFRRTGEECTFVLSDDAFALTVHKNGFPAEILHTEFKRMESELQKLSALFKRLRPTCVIVDSYYVTETYLKTLKEQRPVVYMDDLSAFAYPADCLVNYNIFGSSAVYETLYRGAAASLPQLFLGPSYAPLREEFKQVKKRPQPVRVKNVLISTGGADPAHLGLRCMCYLAKAKGKYDEFCFHVVVGALNADADKITAAAEGLKNVEILKNVSSMKDVMLHCDLAVAAAGSTLYELCACGVPTITYILADNQKQGAKAFEKQGLMISIGDVRGNDAAPETIFHAVKALSDDMERRMELSAGMQKTVDGCGADRLAQALSVWATGIF